MDDRLAGVVWVKRISRRRDVLVAMGVRGFSLFSFGSAPLLSRNSTSLSLSLTLAAIMSGVQPISS